MLKMYKKTRCHLCNVQKHKNHEFFSHLILTFSFIKSIFYFLDKDVNISIGSTNFMPDRQEPKKKKERDV